MGIRKAIGLGIAIIVLKFLMSGTFSAFESTMTTIFTRAGDIVSSGELR